MASHGLAGIALAAVRRAMKRIALLQAMLEQVTAGGIATQVGTGNIKFLLAELDAIANGVRRRVRHAFLLGVLVGVVCCTLLALLFLGWS